MTEAFGAAPGIHELPTDPHTGRAIVPEKDRIAAADMLGGYRERRADR